MPQKAVNEIPDALRHFDQLPDAAQVRILVVAQLFAISKATAWRRVRSGALPKPHKHGLRTTTWAVGDLRAALAAHEAGHE